MLDERDDEVRYLDLDRDGVPDAVEIVHSVAYDTTGDGTGDVFETTQATESEIDIEGVPHHTESRRSLRVEHAGASPVRWSLAERLRRAHRVDGFAAVRVRPRLVREGLERLRACGERLREVRVAIGETRVVLSSPAPSPAWRATYSLPARLKRGAPSDAVVPTEELAEALLWAESVHARGVPLIARPPNLWIGDNELVAVRDAPPVAPSQALGPQRVVVRGVVVPRPDTATGESSFVFRRGAITTSNSLLTALATAGIPKVDVYERSGRIDLEGSTGRRRGPRLTITGQGLLRYR